MKLLIVSFSLILSINIFAQDMNKTIIDTVKNIPMLVGKVSLEAFTDTTFSGWFNQGVKEYTPKEEVLSIIDKNYHLKDIKIVFGTWCSDSREQLPRFIKILETINFPLNQLTILAVDRKKDDHVGLIKDLDIQKVPTFIIYNDGYEMGRIIETPQKTLEEDLSELLNKKM